jgi:ABC-type antimicrobial peptide transport system permease subunit
MIRTDVDPGTFRGTFVSRLGAVDPDAAVSDVGTMRQMLEASLGPRRFTLGLFGAFALTAVLLAVIGLYGLVSYAVSQRASEIGLRLAIGATPRDVQSMILRQAVGLGLAGTVAGLAVTGALHPLLGRMRADVSIGPTMAVCTAMSIVGIVLIAAWLPARRAARIEPTLALRAQ